MVRPGCEWSNIEIRRRTPTIQTAAEIADAILARYVVEFEKFQARFVELEKETP